MMTFAGVTTKDTGVKWEDEFEVIMDGGSNVILISKEEFHHQEEGLDFYYKYGISIMDYDEFTGDGTGTIMVEFLLVPSPKSIHQELLLELMESAGIDEDDFKKDSEYLYYDLVTGGYGVQLDVEELEGICEPCMGLTDLEGIQYTLNSISSIYKLLDNMRGFALDRPWNRIGTNGWDTLNNAINNEPLFKF